MFKRFPELPENNTNVTLFDKDRTGAEFALEANFRALLGDKVFLELVRVSRGSENKSLTNGKQCV